LPADTKVTVVEPPAGGFEKVSLSKPRFFPAQPLVGQPLQLIVRAVNNSDRTKEIRTTLKLDGATVGGQTFTLAAREQRDVAFESSLSGTGEHRFEFATGGDGFPVDDQAYVVVRGVERLPVLVVSDDNPGEPGSAAYFLVRALAP